MYPVYECLWLGSGKIKLVGACKMVYCQYGRQKGLAAIEKQVEESIPVVGIGKGWQYLLTDNLLSAAKLSIGHSVESFIQSDPIGVYN